LLAKGTINVGLLAEELLQKKTASYYFGKMNLLLPLNFENATRSTTATKSIEH
jgi:hypothetical protein